MITKLPKKPMTELDKKLQEIALLNWHQFVELVGEDSILVAKICLLRRRQKTHGEIINKLNISAKKARWWCQQCTTRATA